MRALIAVVPALILGACNQAESTPGSAPGPAGSRSFAASNFDQVKLAGSDDVRVVAGPAFSVQATGPQKILDALEIGVEGNILKIGRKSHGWSWGWSSGSKGAIVTVTMPAIKAVSLSGSGDLSVDQVDGTDFDANLAGSGNLIIARARVEKLNVDLAGSGDVSVAGTTKLIDVSVAGSGDVMARDMAASEASISIAGSGNVDARASVGASVSIIGSGDVTITGTSNCQISKVGSGEVICKP